MYKRKLSSNIPNNSDKNIVFKRGNLTYKILKDDERYKEKTIIRLDELSENKSLVLPLELLYHKDEFIGYTMIYYKQYQVLFNLLKDPNLSFEQRKRICEKLIQIQNYLLDKDYAYFDFHSHNVLINGEDIKLIDMESGEFKGDYGIFSASFTHDTFHQYLYLGNKSLNQLILSILYGVYTSEVLEYAKKHKKELLKYIPKELKPLLLNIVDSEQTIVNPKHYMDLLDEDFINSSKLVLKK